ncbi:MAG: capsule assembly Wzi family protein [Nitrospirae bacterium]|nr:capsule assembly Wzi family protein [Nitrospirota bacterium]
MTDSATAWRRCVPLAAFLLALNMSFPSDSNAGFWADAGDVQLRHDIQRLADAGIISGPVATWPISWADIRRDLSAHKGAADGPLAIVATGILERAERETAPQTIKTRGFASVSAGPRFLNSFAAAPREGVEAGVALEQVSAIPYRLRASWINGDDGKLADTQARIDGSYVELPFADGWAVSAESLDRWWGPGWEGSLILSNNARPVPALVLQRYNSAPFETKWLSWIGPWRFLFFNGRLEHTRDYSDAMLAGMRFDFRPAQSLEIGFSRAMQWGGEGRPSDMETFGKMLMGRDNRGSDGITRANEPGNQLAGIDARWASPVGNLPYAVYAQAIGEDECDHLPCGYTGLGGVEFWGAMPSGGSWRAHMEYADTAVDFYKSPKYNDAYENGIYTSGYRHYNRSLGHPMDNDGTMMSMGFLMAGTEGRAWSLLVRYAKLNRDGGGPNGVSDVARRMTAIEFGNITRFGWGTISLKAGIRELEPVQSGDKKISAQMSLGLEREFQVNTDK